MTVPHFSFPLTLSGTAFAVNEQDTFNDVRDCLSVLVLTEEGSRMVLPGYGIPPVLFAQDPLLTPELLAKVTQWEPRASVSVHEFRDVWSQLIEHIRLGLAV